SHCNNERIRPDDPRYDPDHLALGRIAAGDWSYFRVLDRMLLYERRIENSLYKTINKLKTQQMIRVIEQAEANKPKTIPEAFNFEAATQNPTAEKNSDLKKQSQFTQPLMDVTSYMKGEYDNNPASGLEENKPNQSQILASEPPKGVGKRKKSLAEANLLAG
ncbi:MAG: hypothetical protein WBC05_23085, partial [Sedimentisphaerales bacterium]